MNIGFARSYRKKHRPGSAGPAIGVLLLAALSCGCAGEQNTEEILADYVARIAGALDSDIDVGPAPRPSLPRPRDRQIELPDTRLGLIEFLTFYDCDLQRLVGARNSGLGRVMGASQRFIYEVALMREVSACRAQLAGRPRVNADAIETLDTIVAGKTDVARRTLYNATIGGPEWQRFFSRSGGGTATAGSTGEAFAHLADTAEAVAAGRWDVDTSRLEWALEQLHQHAAGGLQLDDLALLQVHLSAAARALDTRLAGHPICFKPQPTPRARILHNVFLKFYIQRVQVLVARTERETRAWLEPLQRLLLALGDLSPPAMQDFALRHLDLQSAQGLWQRYRQALDQHTRAWQAFLKQCGLLPGTNPGERS